MIFLLSSYIQDILQLNQLQHIEITFCLKHFYIIPQQFTIICEFALYIILIKILFNALLVFGIFLKSVRSYLKSNISSFKKFLVDSINFKVLLTILNRLKTSVIFLYTYYSAKYFAAYKDVSLP